MRKCFKMFFVLCIMMFMCSTIEAANISIDKVAKEFEKTNMVDRLNQLDDEKITAVVDKVNNKLNIQFAGRTGISFNFTNDYIELDKRDVIVTEENCHETIFVTFFTDALSEAVLNLSGYENKTLFADDVSIEEFNYETDGFQVIFEDFYFEYNHDDGIGTTSGSFLKYFKISLDSDKIIALADKYAVDFEEKYGDDKKSDLVATKINFDDITSTSVAIYPIIDNYDKSLGETAFCYLYRTTEENGEYELISDVAFNCLGQAGTIDSNLKSGTTYYYKARVSQSDKFSNVFKVTTLEDKKDLVNVSNNKVTSSTTSNPKTGVNIPTVSFIIVGVISIGTIIYVKNKFNNI